MNIQEAKERLPLSTLASRLGMAVTIPERDGKTVQCWFSDRHKNGDRNPSFNFYNNATRAKCFGCNIDLDGPELISIILGLSKKDGIFKFIEMAGGQPTQTPYVSPRETRKVSPPQDLSEGTESDWRALAALRNLDYRSIHLAVIHGVLKFATVHGFKSWIITDEERIVMEARRIDGKPFPRLGKLAARKSHTISGSVKSWPVGIHAKNNPKTKKMIFCEGGPDLLAAYHFNYVLRKMDSLPVSILGRSIHAIHPKSLPHFKDRVVRIFPHADEDGGGIIAAKRWSKQIKEAGATEVKGDSLELLGVNDLNDCTKLNLNTLGELLP